MSDTTMGSLEEAEEVDFGLGKPVYKVELIVEKDLLQQQCLEEEINSEGIGGKEGENDEAKLDYQEIQTQNILSKEERKIMWENYKHYVDEKVFIELKNATLCR